MDTLSQIEQIVNHPEVKRVYSKSLIKECVVDEPPLVYLCRLRRLFLQTKVYYEQQLSKDKAPLAYVPLKPVSIVFNLKHAYTTGKNVLPSELLNKISIAVEEISWQTIQNKEHIRVARKQHAPRALKQKQLSCPALPVERITTQQVAF